MSKFLKYVNQQYGSIKKYLVDKCEFSQENINKILDKFTLLKDIYNVENESINEITNIFEKDPFFK